MTQNPPASAEEPYVRTVAALATALDSLGARIYRDLHVENTDIAAHAADPQLVETLSGFTAYAEDCLAVLNDPEVRTVLDTALASRSV